MGQGELDTLLGLVSSIPVNPSEAGPRVPGVEVDSAQEVQLEWVAVGSFCCLHPPAVAHGRGLQPSRLLPGESDNVSSLRRPSGAEKGQTTADSGRRPSLSGQTAIPRRASCRGALLDAMLRRRFAW